MTAVDLTQDMLEQAKENANHYKVEVEFKLLENQFLPFPDNTFDLVVSRDVTWMLQDAEGVLKEWYRVTKKAEKFCTLMPIGTTIYLMKMKEKTFGRPKDGPGKGGFIYNKSKIMENLAKVLPLSQTFRPDWDKRNITYVGIPQHCDHFQRQFHCIYRKEQIQYASKPEFLVVAEK